MNYHVPDNHTCIKLQPVQTQWFGTVLSTGHDPGRDRGSTAG